MRNTGRKFAIIAPNHDQKFPMAWFLLVLAGFLEVGFTTALSKAKESSGQAYLFWLAVFFVSMSLSMFFLYRATLTLPMGTAYAVWTGIGAAGTAIVGILFFREPAHLWRLFFLTTLIASIIGLKYVTK
jgi:quaternary ammonium compound-resistance protein SugE